MSTTCSEEHVARYGQARVLEQEQVTVSNHDCQWYALQTHSRHEKQVRDRLLAVGIESLLPLGRQRRQWSDRKVWTMLPLFKGAWVEVIRGPLAGLRGQLVRRANHHGLVVRASLLQRAALIHLTDEVTPVR